MSVQRNNDLGINKALLAGSSLVIRQSILQCLFYCYLSLFYFSKYSFLQSTKTFIGKYKLFPVNNFVTQYLFYVFVCMFV